MSERPLHIRQTCVSPSLQSPLSLSPLLGAIFGSEIEKLCCEMENVSASCHRGFNLVSEVNDSPEDVSACCHGLEGPGGLVANLRGCYLCYSQIIPLSAVLPPSFCCAGVRLAWADTGDGIPLWKKIELHLLVRLGKALKFPVRFSQKFIM